MSRAEWLFGSLPKLCLASWCLDTIRVSHWRHLLTSIVTIPSLSVFSRARSVTVPPCMPPYRLRLGPVCPGEKSALRFAWAAACILEMKEARRRCSLVAEEQACGKSRAQNVRRHSKWPLGASYVCVQKWIGQAALEPLIDLMICVSSQSSVPVKATLARELARGKW
ncbi:hypothetical protein V8C42DRAFT_279485 [Trichoderma barbatum]